MNKIVLSLFLFSGIVITTKAQQDPRFSMYWNNFSFYNPAASGANYKHHAYSLDRIQWNGIPGNPKTLQGGYDTWLSGINSGIGFNYTYDEIGYEKNHLFNINYSYHINLGKERYLALGASGGTYTKSFTQPNVWITPDGTPWYNDPTLTQGPQTKFNVNTGIFYHDDQLNIGVSATHINHPYFSDLSYQSDVHLYGVASYKIEALQNFTITPSRLVKSDLNSSQIDMNLLFTYNNIYWAGAGFRPSESLVFMGGVDLMEKWRLGYAFDLTITQLQGYNSHEVVLAYMLK